MNRTIAIIQARMGSTRLPGKVMMNILGKSVLSHVITRISLISNIDHVVVATTKNESDDIIADEAKANGALIYRGSEEDVLRRFYEAAVYSEANTIVRITSDCPLIDPTVTADIIKSYQNNKYDYVSNCLVRTFPRGLDTEVFSFSALEKACLLAKKSFHREHVTPFIYENKDIFSILDYTNKIDFSKYRLTLDTIDDFNLINEIFKHFFYRNPNFNWHAVIDLLERNEDLYRINAHVEQKTV